jgi:hypothetical protein
MINGAHVIINSENPDVDRDFLRDVLGLPHVDVGEGWLIFALPPSELAIHPSDKNDVHQLYLMCHDVEALIHALTLQEVESTPVQDEGWGLVTQITLPGGGKLPIYQPRHARPSATTDTRKRGRSPGAKPARKKVSKKVSKKASKKPVAVATRGSAAKRKKAAPAKRKKASKRGRA